jgi:serine/threonine protein kinase
VLPSAPPVRTAEPGTIVAGRYRVVRTLGGGGMGRVYEVVDLGTQQTRALKILHRQLADDPVMVERFLREARALGSLDHPSIVQVHAWGPLDDGSLYIVLELVPGQTLDRALRAVGAMDVATFAPIFRDLALGLQYAHERGIVHRDLKPSNVILSHDGGAKLIDFGVSLLAGASRVTRTGEHLGTPRYMAPEQLLGAHDVDRRTDVYALGVVAYEALGGGSPFPLDHGAGALVAAVLGGAAVPLRSRRPDLPAALGDVIASAMARSRDDRFPDVLAMMTAWDVATRSVDSFAPATIAMPSSSPPGPMRSSDPGDGTGAEDAVTGRMMPKTPRIGELPGAIAAMRGARPGPSRLESPTPSPTLGAGPSPSPSPSPTPSPSRSACSPRPRSRRS